jgi:hypothetical protein
MAFTDTGFDQYYNEVINALKGDGQWDNYSFLYNKDDNKRKDNILECYNENLHAKTVVRIEKTLGRLGKLVSRQKKHGKLRKARLSLRFAS